MKGFDTNTKLSYAKAKEFKNASFEFVIRYVGRTKQASFDIDKQELADILKAGLKLGLVQHCPGKPGIIPSCALGVTYGKNASLFARESGYKPGCIIYLDLEDVNIKYKNKQQDIFDYCNFWYYEVLNAGYTPGIYIGFNNFMSSHELYTKIKFKDYWRSFSNVPNVETRGYAIQQQMQTTVNGIQIDTNIMLGDTFGRSPIFMEAEKYLVSVINIFSDGTIEVQKGVNNE